MKRRCHALAVFTPLLLALYTASIASAITTAGNPDDYLVTPGTGFDGVVGLSISRTDGLFGCSGALLSSGNFILTAAHCISDFSGNVNVTSSSAFFTLAGGTQVVSGAGYIVHPRWDGSLANGFDIGLIRLGRPAPAAADRYTIYRASNELGRTPTIVGYGFSGTGATGYDAAAFPEGTPRKGMNRYDENGSAFGLPNQQGLLLYDFDDGTAIHDGFGFLGLTRDRGLGLKEVLAAPADSGGPSFLNGAIAGVHSFGAWDGSPPDNDGIVLNASFGEFAA